MLHVEEPKIRELMLCGDFGLEKENLRIDRDGHLSHTKHPFLDDPYIVRDFSENQTEVNTPVMPSAKEAVACLAEYNRKIQVVLRDLPEREYLWQFSNPPYIRNEEDIPIAQFTQDGASKQLYREYLSDRYGRYKMTFCGIHVNYSFSEKLLKSDFELSGQKDFFTYKNQFYLSLAEKAAAYGWILVAVTAASPVLDSSFVEKGRFDEDTFMGMASVRCSELGYWNAFAPIFDYSSMQAYADSIQKFVDDGLLLAASELYYPIRLKPAGENTLEALRENGINHIELRMFDLNPLVDEGVEEKDVRFAQLFLVWLAGTPEQHLSRKNQVQAVQNFKYAAHYDLKTVKIVLPNGEVASVAHAALKVISQMKEFFRDYPEDVQEVLEFEEAKFINQENRYAWKVRHQFSPHFVKKGLELAKQRQEEN